MNAAEPSAEIADRTRNGIQTITWRRILSRIIRIAVAIVITIGWAWALNKSVVASNNSPTPAGFGRGALHGALMPGAMPVLFLGKDVTIYAQNNAGRTYKLGYTFGVNACGALFFGAFYWRLNRWRSRNSATVRA
jgi:hypothetical protein